LVFAVGDGDPNSVELPGPGGEIRFSVGRPGCHSAIWKIWAGRNESSVYVVVRDIGGDQKWSLHESGDWRHQWVTPERAEKFTGSSNRVIDRWSPPAELGESGWTKGLAIRVRQKDVVSIPEDDESLPADVVWVPAPAEGYVMGIHVIVARPSEVRVELRDAVPAGGFTLADGRVVLLIAAKESLTEEMNLKVEAVQAEEITRMASAGIDLHAVPVPRMLVAGFGLEGGRFVWDTCVSPPALETAPRSAE
jgi:hypothetical protein